MKSRKGLFLCVLTAVLAGCSDGSIAKSSKQGEINPLEIADEAVGIARQKHPQAVLIGLKSSGSKMTWLGLPVSRFIDDTFKRPTGKADIWDYYFAQDANGFIKEEGALNRPDTYSLPPQKQFGIRYHDGKYIYLAPENFQFEADYLASTQGLKPQVALTPEKLLPRVREELQKIYGTDKISSIAYSLKDYGFSWPPTADSWMDRHPKTAPTWEVVAVLEDGLKGAAFFMNAETGELVDDTEQFTVTTGP